MCKIDTDFLISGSRGFVKKGHVVSVAVLEEHRSKGLGKALMLEGTNGIINPEDAMRFI